MSNSITTMYDSKSDLIVLGLTGRTGSGCTTVSKILKKADYKDLDVKSDKNRDFNNADEIKDYIVNNYIKNDNRWKPFTVIEVSSVLIYLIFNKPISDFQKYMCKITTKNQKDYIELPDRDSFISNLTNFNYIYEYFKDYKDLYEYIISGTSYCKDKLSSYVDFLTESLVLYREQFKNVLKQISCDEIIDDGINGKIIKKHNLYTYLLQNIGNNIRASGDPFNEMCDENGMFNFGKKLENIINIIYASNDYKQTRICIDAIRNPYEAVYLQNKFRFFYLMAVNTNDIDRKQRLGNLTAEQLKNLDDIEYPQKFRDSKGIFYHQSIESCIEYSGIHISNPNTSNEKLYELTQQLIKYIALILHPGLITPSHIERCMQLAYNTKFNSGCLSRQVGAVVTRSDFSIQSVGWNDVPKGQTPCLLRNTKFYCDNRDSNLFSKFEIEDKTFSNALEIIEKEAQKKLHGRCLSYCFKDVYNGLTNQKNQVYTRALHAEENAFLQISKYGGTQVKNGYLFTTASPCELCAKKAYQLGIKKIFYINPYPGISRTHILQFGKENNPELELFYGAIGKAYIDFYEPVIATKDELELLTEINVKELITNEPMIESIAYNDICYDSIEVELDFKSRESIVCKKTYECNVQNKNITKLIHYIKWTGSVYENTKIESNDIDVKRVRTVDKDDLHKIIIDLDGNSKNKLTYTLITTLKDELHKMQPYLAHMIKHKTENLKLKIKSSDNEILKNVKFKIYADLYMKTQIQEKASDGLLSQEINKPNVNYTYSIEWDFNNERNRLGEE